MIRPITLICFAAACGSGLYLYQEKHRVQVLDHQIEHTVKLTEQTRAQTRMLHAEWTLLNDPDRLRKLAAQFLPDLQPVAPTQYTDMANLDSRLPAVPPLPPPAPPAQPGTTPDTGLPVAQGGAPAQVDANATAPAAVAAPVRAAEAATPATPAQPPVPPAQVTSVTPRPHLPTPHVAPSHVAVAQARPADIRAPTHIHDARYEPRPAEPDRHWRDAHREPFHAAPLPAQRRPMIAEAARVRFTHPAPLPQSYGGSMLGMAQGHPTVPAPVPLPQPMPYQSFGGGGGG